MRTNTVKASTKPFLVDTRQMDAYWKELREFIQTTTQRLEQQDESEG